MPDGFFDPDAPAEQASEQQLKRGPREQGGIEFPYVSVDTGISVARALLELGAVPVERDQLAARMGHTLSGGLINKISAARMFGLVELAAGKYQLTQLGHAILDSSRSAAARADAFLRVPLYRRIYDEFRNNQLPPSPHGLEQAMVQFGVPQKQKDKARRAFENSARQTGFFAHGNNRLVAPVIPLGEVAAEAALADPRDENRLGKDSDRSKAEAADYPFIKGLLLSLPKVGERWSTEERLKWLRTAIDAFDLMYEGGDTQIMVTGVDPVKLAWTGFVQLLSQSDPDSVTPRMLLSTLIGAWRPPNDDQE
jgi:hypothetical protein